MKKYSMDKATADTITECKILLMEAVKDIAELKNNSVSREAYKNLDDRVKNIEGSISKITWAIVMAVIGAVLSLVMKSI